MARGWRFWIDRGGTFTDVVAVDPAGKLRSLKLLSEAPEHYSDAALEAIRRLMDCASIEEIPSDEIETVRMATTVGTNALLERKGATTLYVTTAGFGDQLLIGDQTRPDIFALHIQRPAPLNHRAMEVAERLDADGTILLPLDQDGVRKHLREAKEQGFQAVAIALLHAYKNPVHEQQVAKIALELGFEQVSASHEVVPVVRLLPRAETTVADAYLSPKLRRYVQQVQSALPQSQVLFMQSNGGLTEAEQFRGRDCVLSGPAAGVVGAAKTGKTNGHNRVLSFDMGGTSTDVAAYDGDYERADETSVAGVRLRTPIMDVHTVAAGGGSICNVEAGRLAVGPESAGANPGPACYGKGGPATLTDCNVLLGKIQPRHFPAVFGPSGDQPLNPEASRKRLRSLREEVGSQKSLEALAEDFLRIGVRHMANAIKRISVERGRDPENFVLNCFGGAGPQHACLVAEALGMERVLIHPLAGVLSAAGLGLADGRSLRQKSLETELGPEAVALIEQEVNELWRQAVASSGQPAEQVLREVNVQLRYAGTDTLLSVPFNSLSAMQQQFESRHREMFGFVFEDRALVVGSVVVEAVQPGEESLPPVAKPSATPAHEPVELFSGGRWHRVPVLPRESVAEAMEGPLLLTEPLSTQVVEPGWKVQPTNTGALELVRQEHRTRAHAEKEADPALLEIFNSAFMGVAEQMGAVLQKTARSVNIKERRDFSCALFDRHGDLVANAPHVPVHLGSMSDSVRSVMGRFEGEMKKSDAYIINDPYNGGTHLPDITVVSPVFIGEAPPSFYLASRGHHADVGGVSPGSMPAFSKSILEEGVRFSGQRLVSKGEFLHEAIREQLTAQPHPARNPDQNLADLQAQVAANERGLQALQALIDEFGLPVVQAYTKHVQRNAAHQVKQALAAFVEGEFEKTMDSGLQIKLRLRREQSRLVFDFSGSSSIDKSNYNAPESITRAVVLYALRSLVQERIPLNEGCLKAVRLSIPAASFLSPEHPAAVVAGNVETSQVLADTVFGALGALAGSQATMNNLTFGNERHQYYDTLCGGTGAGPDHPGASGVHSHMTNSVLTDPEILELRYPVRLEHFRLRRGSGGNGRFQGGEGVERLIRFLEPMTLSLLTNSRQVAPHGLGGGQAGEPGENWLLKSNGTKEELPYAAQQKVEPGDALLIKTPGGGGYGQPSS